MQRILCTDIAGQPIGPSLKGQAVFTPALSANNYKYTLRNISEL